MTLEQIREVHHATPFRPFTLHTADGKSVRVPHPDFMSVSPSGRTLFVFGDGDSHHIIEVRLVTQIEVHEAATK
jgi:hypothetical protein